jgi:methylmalonyl-CoA mutase
LSASVGFVNKSLKDPFTNLLRQTTEVMSAIVGGVDSLTILPYDKLSTKGTSDFALRMAQNIPLILKEESYFDKVIDPLGGSYSIEKLTDEVIQISWDLFQELEGLNGVFNSECQLYLKKEIQKVVELKLAAYASNEKTLIGVNKFKALTEEEGEWKIEESVLGLSQFIIENNI